MLRTRVIPTLLLRNESLVKTVQFGKFAYVGDPCNTVRIFNELGVDELLFLDIAATRERRSPNLNVLRAIADECFMPLGYGGGIRTIDHAKAIFDIGFEKVAINSYAAENRGFITELARIYGSQAVIASVDVKRTLLGRYRVVTESGTRDIHKQVIEWVRELERCGAGEILLTSIDREGTWRGFDIPLVKAVSEAVQIPVIAHGGAGSLSHIRDVVTNAGASAVAVGSMVVFQAPGMGVLVNMPDQAELSAAIAPLQHPR